MMPDHVKELANECGLLVEGWDEDSDDAVITGEDVNYIGSKAECIAFLTAWQQCKGRVRRSIIGLWGNVDANMMTQIVTRPQSGVFRGERIAIPDTICVHFQIDDIRVGNRSMMPTSGSIPGEAFAVRLRDSLAPLVVQTNEKRILSIHLEEYALKEFGRAVTMDNCQVAQDLVIGVTNISNERRAFRAFILGKHA